MKPGAYFKIIVCVLALGPVAARADDTLDSWIAQALENNSELGAAKKKWEAATHKVPQATAWEDPMIGADVERMGTTRFDDYTDVEWMISQKVPWFGKRASRGRVEQGAANQAEQEFLAKRLEVAARVKRFAYDYWQSQQELEINRRHRTLLDQFVQIVTVRYEAGKASQADVFKAEVAFAKLKEDRFDRQRELQKAQVNLNALVKRAPDAPIELTLPEQTVPAVATSLDSLLQASEQRPELRAIQRGAVVSAQASLAVARKVYAPDIEFRVEARSYNGRSGLQEYDTGVFLSFPWLNERRNRAAIAEARANVERNAEDYEAMKQATLAAVKQTHDGMVTMHHHYELFASAILPVQRAAVEAARASYEADKATFLEVIDAQRELLDSEMQQIHHVAEYHRLQAELERLVGGTLPNPSAGESK